MRKLTLNTKIDWAEVRAWKLGRCVKCAWYREVEGECSKKLLPPCTEEKKR